MVKALASLSLTKVPATIIELAKNSTLSPKQAQLARSSWLEHRIRGGRIPTLLYSFLLFAAFSWSLTCNNAAAPSA